MTDFRLFSRIIGPIVTLDVDWLGFSHLVFQADSLPSFSLLTISFSSDSLLSFNLLVIQPSSFSVLSLSLPFIQSLVSYSSITQPSLYSQPSTRLAFYVLSRLYSQTQILYLIASAKFRSVRGLSHYPTLMKKCSTSRPRCQPQIENNQFENSEFGETLRWKYWY